MQELKNGIKLHLASLDAGRKDCRLWDDIVNSVEWTPGMFELVDRERGVVVSDRSDRCVG